MSRSRSLFAALGVVLALAVTAVAAQATEGPYYKVSGTRLASGSTKVMTVKRKESIIMVTFGTVVITCTGVNSLSGTKIAGSSGMNSGTSEVKLEFTGCTVTGAGEPCEIQNSKITTTLLKGTLGYGTATRTGALEMLLKPASGTTISNTPFVGSGCIFLNLKMEGKMIVFVRSGGSAVEVGVNEVQAKTNELQFKPTNATKIWTESAGTLTETKSNLTDEGVTFTVNGIVNQELEGMPEWGTFTP